MSIAALIHDRGLRQTWVADQLDISISHFRSICSGRRQLLLKHIPDLARVIGATEDDVARAALATWKAAQNGKGRANQRNGEPSPESVPEESGR